MAAVKNTSARIYNLKAIDKKTKERVKVALNPGLNDVDSTHWDALKDDAFVKTLIKEKIVLVGNAIEDELLENGPDTETLSKSEPTSAKTE